jgi:hypothetical protein
MGNKMKSIIALLFTALAAFGINPSGGDDTAALQALLTDAGSANPGNIRIQLEAGEYHLSAPLYWPSVGGPNNPVLMSHAGGRISGAGMGETRLVWTCTNSAGLSVTSPIGFQGLTIEDLCLIGPVMTRQDTNDTSIGLPIGRADGLCFSGENLTVRNVAILGWGMGMAVTNVWGILVDGCVVRSNTIEGIRFAGTHGAHVQNCQVGGGWAWPVGIGIGFHPPPNACYGDNGEIQSCILGPCTVGVHNNELNLVCENVHLERCGVYYRLLTWASATTIIGGYTLDCQSHYWWTNGYDSQILMDSSAARQTVIQQTWLTSGLNPPRLVFAVTPDASAFALPTYIGMGTLKGRYGGTPETVYPLVTRHRFWQSTPPSAVRLLAQ